MLIKTLRNSKQAAANVIKHVQKHGAACPCHGCKSLSMSGISTGNANTDYAFEMAASNIRYGSGVTAEVGMDFANMGIDKVALFTDSNLAQLHAVQTTIKSLEKSGIKYDVYDKVIIEPKDYGIRDAIQWAREKKPKAYLAVGGGSVIDTAKIANLFQIYPDADLMEFVNAPIGNGRPVDKDLYPLVAVPTTAGTGSETTGTAIFDLTTHGSKTGIASRKMKPLLGIVDPLNSATMPASVKASSGLNVLCHSLESYTAIPYNERTPRPSNPLLRPAYQGANPISDIFSEAALRMVVKYLPRSVKDPEDIEAQEKTLLAATLAGVGFGNAGVHLCHGLSYPISSQNKTYKHYDYQVDHPIVPHGVSVAVTSPAVFRYTAASNPERHLHAASLFGVDVTNVKKSMAGEVLADAIKDFLYNKLGDQPRGIEALGFTASDIPKLVDGALPQRRVLSLAPSVHAADDETVMESLAQILTESLRV